MLADLTCRFVSRRAPRRSRRLKGEAGTSLVEYAFVFVFFMTILFGITGFGHMLYAYHFANHAAKEATRWAAVNGLSCNNDSTFSSNGKGSCTAPVTCSAGSCTTCTSGCAPATSTDITNYVKMIIPQGIDSSKVTVNPSWPGDGTTYCGTVATQNGASCPVEVQVSYQYNFIFPLIPTGPVTISSTSEMVIAH